MKVILLENVRNFGKIGEEVSVKNGYARNYLIPQKKAILATKENVAKIMEKRSELEKRAADLFEKAKARAEALAKFALLTIYAKVSDEGKLFGSIGIRDIVHAFKDAGIEVQKSEISLPQGSIRQIGEYDVDIQLHPDITETIKIKIEPQAKSE